ncbi:hypothetical protein ACJRO7_021028 [Eucalyptus globulus]|uniref:TIR domain-containing protein n=1 Tax=Eucalyptus globulus TaxID=34317 RepID=A0ABD3KK38_EUCGL
MASSPKSKSIYDVFLSFRDMDVRKSFLSHLYQALDQNGIHTFQDREKLRKGDQISATLMKAIEESCIAIIIFSENYASSLWCLEETAKIMECKEQKDLTVLPVFYKVDPREVREGRKIYREALDKHEDKFKNDLEKVKKWKKALFDAGNLSGWHLNDEDKSELIQEIVNKISTYLDRPLHVAKHPIGIYSRVTELKSMLKLESNDGVPMVGLWGQGGIGKTCLAKALYNALFRKFEGACFLANVRETSKDSRGLVTLQETILNDILLPQQRLEVSNVDVGSNLIQRRLGRKKVLLILDDWFGNGSRIIVTTRDKQLLTCHRIDQDHVYKVEALSNSEAHELLSKHAFQTHQIRTDLVDGALKYAKGLPLALEVLGSSLCDTTEDVWESTIKKLSRNPDKDINNVLKVSFDGLDENEKEIFLHIACFFKGWAREHTKKVLDSCDLETIVGFDILIKRSLIRIEGGILQMHDLIQAMGMDIVNRECRDDPGRRNKLWLYDDVVDVLSRDMGDCAVKAIVLALPEPTEMRINPDDFTKLRRLRLLILHNVHSSFQGPICLPSELRWFEWPGCAHENPKFSASPKKSVGLNMSKGNITEVLKQFKAFQNLKYINFSHCDYKTLKTYLILSANNITTLPSINKRDHLDWPIFTLIPGGEMPQWVLPIEEGFLSFMASKDLYDKILGLVICYVLNNDRLRRPFFQIESSVNGKMQLSNIENYHSRLDSVHLGIEYAFPSKLWGDVDFVQIDRRYLQFGLTLSGESLNKWGVRIICKQLGEDLKVELRDNKLIDPALLYEVGNELTDSPAESSLVHEDNSSIADRPEDLQDSQMGTEEHSHTGSKRNHEFILTQGMRTKIISTSNSTGRDENGGDSLFIHTCHICDQHTIQDLQDLDLIATRYGFIRLAKVALDSLEVPVGCLIVEEVHLTATGRNSTNETGNSSFLSNKAPMFNMLSLFLLALSSATRHGETEALDVFIEERTGFSSAEVAEKFSACSLYVTCESCIMCAAAKSIIGMKEVYYGCTNDIFGGCGSILSFYSCSSEVCNSQKCCGKHEVAHCLSEYDIKQGDAPCRYRTAIRVTYS